MKKRALLSVSDKTGIVEFAKELTDLGYEIISTGGTHKALEAAGIKVIGISEITGFPECLDGRVKTLDPHVHAGLLAMRSNPEHMAQLKKLNINTIDVVAVNLYPFKATIMKPGVEFAEAVENIDIGGPTMLRSAAKNYQDVFVVVDPADYKTVTEAIRAGGDALPVRRMLMYKVYQHTAVYDTMIADYLRSKLDIAFPEQLTLAFEKAQDLRYGENPHQSAVFYRECFPVPGALTEAEQLHGKELSYNNINDTNGALDLLREFKGTAVVAVKHANPCGVGLADTVAEAYQKAFDGDPVSIFGGIVAVNGVVDKAAAEKMSKTFLEIIVARDFTAEALEILEQKKNIRLLKLPTINSPVKAGTYDMKKVLGGLLVQSYNTETFHDSEMKVVTNTAPTPEQMEDLKFAMLVVKHTKSNAIVVAKDGQSLGIGAGQTNRIWAAEQAFEHAGERVKGAVMASDAFFPFDDCVEAAHKAGITAIIQPGGSVRDQDSIDACNKYGIAMIFTGMRHFKH